MAFCCSTIRFQRLQKHPIRVRNENISNEIKMTHAWENHNSFFFCARCCHTPTIEICKRIKENNVRKKTMALKFPCPSIIESFLTRFACLFFWIIEFMLKRKLCGGILQLKFFAFNKFIFIFIKLTHHNRQLKFQRNFVPQKIYAQN